MSGTIYLNDRQLLEVQEFVAMLELDLQAARTASNAVCALQLEAELVRAREVLDHCLAYMTVQVEH